MASIALTTFNTAIDGLSLTSRQKSDLKVLGERLYIAGQQEAIAHLRKHISAVADDTSNTVESRELASDWRSLVDSMPRGDAWWLDIQALAEPPRG